MPSANERPAINIIPRPVSIKQGRGSFQLYAHTAIVISADEIGLQNSARYLAEKVEFFTRISPEIINPDENEPGRPVITLALMAKPIQAELEYYHLTVSAKEIILEAFTPAGIFRGIQSLLQLIHVTDARTCEAIIPEVEIKDYASFFWRGMHLDVSRHFFPKEFIKKYIDLIAMYKMNIFHWHLTDDQGWRIEIKKYPRLSEIGAWRTEEDGRRYGGYYTQDDIREIVAYAQARYVTIIPEIDMPGHSLAALAAYPEYSCTGGPFEVASTWGIFDDVFCPGKEETFTFLEGILDEVIGLFSCPYIHIGGDECPKTRWRNHDLCKERIKLNDLKDEDHLQGFFVDRISSYALSRGVRVVGWDEIMEGDISSETIVMAWRGMEYGLKAINEGHAVIMTPTSHCYFDYYQAREGEPKAIGGYLPLDKVYEFNPIPGNIQPEKVNMVLGGQGNVWTEYMPGSNHVEYMLLPRMCAMAEALWSPIDTRNFDDFIKRLKAHYPRFDLLETFYRPHDQMK